MAKARIIRMVVVGMVCVGFVMGCHRLMQGTPAAMENGFSFGIYPVLRVQQGIVDTVHAWIRDRQDMAQLKKKLEHTQQECEQLRAENIQLAATQKYGEDIGELDLFRKQYAVDASRIVHILFKHFSPKEHYFLVDAGENRGIEKNMVAVYKNCLIGKVEQVYAWYSKVRLVTDASCKVAAYCADTKINGIYQGCNEQGSALLQYVPHFALIKQQDMVMSSGEGLIFPQGFGLGSIESCQQDGLYHQIRIKPQVDMESLSYCVLMARGE